MSIALGYTAFGGPEVQEFLDRPVRPPEPNEVAVRITAAGVNPLDHLLRAGHVRALNGHLPFPQVLGMEGAGVVTALGGDVTGLAIGDRVFGFALTGAGTYCADTLLLGEATARIPDGLSDTWAATVPVAATTALDALDQLGLPEGTTLLVNGVGGGVGLATAQLARRRGLTVIGTGSSAKRSPADAVGVQFVDYTAGDVVEEVRRRAPAGVDGVVDLVGGASLRAVAGLAVDPSSVVSVGDPSVTEVGGAAVERHLDRGTLERAAHLMVTGDLDPTITKVYPLRRADAALALVESGHARGKLVVDTSG